jgi:circadian clock protein KaiC
VAIDAVENLFSAFSDQHVLRGEFRRLIGWLKERGVTALVTTERGQVTLTRNGIEEYIADCVIALDNRVEDQLATRRLRIVKYRGSVHHGDECPFVVERSGFAVLPITSAGLAYRASRERISAGIGGLDDMLSGGYYRGSSVLVSGTSGAGKTSIAAHFVDAACRRGERALYVALEESSDQIERNMASIGIDLGQWQRAGLLQFHAARPTSNGLERHLVNLVALVDSYRPAVVVLDPITAYRATARDDWVKQMLVRAVDLFKGRGITSLFTALTFGADAPESTAVAISSLVDAWLLLRNLESYGERTRALYVCKARGTAHSNQVREFLLGEHGVELVDVAIDADGQVITGSARQLHQSRREQQSRARAVDEARRRKALDVKRRALEARIVAMRAELEEEMQALDVELTGDETRLGADDRVTAELVHRRQRIGGDGE